MNTWLSQKRCDPPKCGFTLFSTMFSFSFSLYLLFFQSGSCHNFNWHLLHALQSTLERAQKGSLERGQKGSQQRGEEWYTNPVTCYNMQGAGTDKSERAALVVYPACPYLSFWFIVYCTFFQWVKDVLHWVEKLSLHLNLLVSISVSLRSGLIYLRFSVNSVLTYGV